MLRALSGLQYLVVGRASAVRKLRTLVRGGDRHARADDAKVGAFGPDVCRGAARAFGTPCPAFTERAPAGVVAAPAESVGTGTRV